MKYDFEHYLLAGHGRAYMIAKADPECYRDRILAACMKDYSFDMQCEGSRAFLTYDLVSLFDDPSYFIETVKKSYIKPETDSDWHQICYLTDLLDLFDQRKTIIEKYKQLEKRLYTDGSLEDLTPFCQSFDYLAIKLIQGHGIKVIWNVVNDIGKWFLTRSEDPHDLASNFLWFNCIAQDEFGEKVFNKLLKYNNDSDGVKEYIKIMSLPFKSGRKDEIDNATSEIVLSWIRKEPRINRFELGRRGLMSMSTSEAVKLAKQFSIETDPDIKAGIASVFTSMKYPWPLDVSILTECDISNDQRLAEQINRALLHLKDDRIHDYARNLLEKGFNSSAVSLLISNIKKSDESFIMNYLEDLPIAKDNRREWHDIVSIIGSHGENPEMPASLLNWAYESTLCSFCRERIVDKMIQRGLLTDELKEELQWDANLDIRDMVDEKME